MTIDEVKSCLNGIELDLMQHNYDDAFTLLNTLVCHAVREGYKLATNDLAIWRNGEMTVGVMECPIADARQKIENSIVSIGKVTTLVIPD